MKNIVLFDLDGTLTDSVAGITNSLMYALDKFGIRVEDRSELYKLVGPPLLNSFMEYYGFDEEKAKRAATYYREVYDTTGKYENEVYEGIPKTLGDLKKAGNHLLVATSKPEHMAKDILEHFSLSEYFDVIAGSDLEGVRNTKGKVIQYALEQYAVLENISVADVKENAVMVGDRLHDVHGAKENGIACIGVLYGYGNREELEEAGADFIAEKPENIPVLIQG